MLMLGDVDHVGGHGGRALKLEEESGTKEEPRADSAIGELVPARPNPTVVTGCIPCLIKGIPCDPRRRECAHYLTNEWRTNDGISSPIDMQWRATRTERHVLNYFVYFTAPQMAGYFDSLFWQKMVIQASYREPAILHALAAVGSLHMEKLRSIVETTKESEVVSPFALQQCNLAIRHLLCTEASAQQPDPLVALTTCLLFTCFETLQGRTEEAVKHALQSKKLLRISMESHKQANTCAVELDTLRPIAERLEIQAKALLGWTARTSDVLLDLPLPVVGKLRSIDQAHSILALTWNKLLLYLQDFPVTAPAAVVAKCNAQKVNYFRPWLNQWEVAFADFLKWGRPLMSEQDLARCMILKANHLAIVILGSVYNDDFEAFESEFRGIVELSAAVLTKSRVPGLPTAPPAKVTYCSFSMCTTDPLYVTMTRTTNDDLRKRAIELLSEHPRQEGIWYAGPRAESDYRRSQSRASSKSSSPGSEVKREGEISNEWLDFEAWRRTTIGTATSPDSMGYNQVEKRPLSLGHLPKYQAPTLRTP